MFALLMRCVSTGDIPRIKSEQISVARDSISTTCVPGSDLLPFDFEKLREIMAEHSHQVEDDLSYCLHVINDKRMIDVPGMTFADIRDNTIIPQAKHITTRAKA